ncbi:MAG: hypothetical protein KF688_11245 [Pirellulales bacterium]|nr:hypothetical protein [Pirellulales bacterium]MBX3432360.1 hypothetical protein [Pirellulales bacterium]
MSHTHLYESDDMNYQGGVSDGFRRDGKAANGRERRPVHGRKRGKAPQSVNGIHRRRRRKIAW